MSLLVSQPAKTFGDIVFSYRVLFAEDEPLGTGWRLTLYGLTHPTCMTMPHARTGSRPEAL
jgi:hypothetical protein